MNDLDIETCSDELQEQDAKNIKEVLEEVLKDVDPSNVSVGVDVEGRLNVFVCGTPIGTIHRHAIKKDGKTIMKATFQPESVS